jgi:hypothetical protein
MKTITITYQERHLLVNGAIDMSVKFSSLSSARSFLMLALQDDGDSYIAVISAVRSEDGIKMRMDTSLQKTTPFTGSLTETHSDKSAEFTIEMPDKTKLFPLKCGGSHIKTTSWQKQLTKKAKQA